MRRVHPRASSVWWVTFRRLMWSWQVVQGSQVSLIYTLVGFEISIRGKMHAVWVRASHAFCVSLFVWSMRRCSGHRRHANPTVWRRAHENTKVCELLRAHLTLQPGEALKHHQLREYVDAAAQGTLTVVMRKERTPVRACPLGCLCRAGRAG